MFSMYFFEKYKSLILCFFITAWPFLNFYASATNCQLIYLNDYFYLFLVFLFVFICLLKVFSKFLKIHLEKLIAVYALFIFLFFNYGLVWDFLNQFDLIRDLPLKFIQYLALSFSLLLLTYKFSKNTAFLKSINVFIFVVFSFSLIEAIVVAFDDSQPVATSSEEFVSIKFKRTPNIYFLLLDAYARADTIYKNTGFQNIEFIKFLKNKGFIVADKSYSNYTTTSMSLSATFKMDYIEEKNVNRNDVLSSDKPVFKILKDNGYNIVVLPAYYPFLSGRNIADTVVSRSKIMDLITHNTNFLAKTVLQQILVIVKPYLYPDIQLVKEAIYQKKGGNFIYMHFLNLHDFAYGKNCIIENVPVLKAESLSYAHNLKCMNLLIQDAVDIILEKDPDGIIIVQGDHSPLEWRQNERPTNPDEFENIFSITSAIYLPSLNNKSKIKTYLENSPSPVNNFRIIFSYLSNLNLPILLDRHFGGEYNELGHLKH